MSLSYCSTFAGVGGFDAAFDRLGMTPTAQVEIDPHCQTILGRHWPTVPKGHDIASVSGADIGRPDLIIGGFPCQDLSIAAPHRRGLAGERSGQYHQFTRLIAEHLRLVDESGSRWVVIENTPGLLTSNDGRDMAAVVGGLEDLGYGWAYRVVDSRHTGSAQRRQRVLVVGHRGGDPRPAWQVLGDTGSGSEVAPASAVRPGRGPAPVDGPLSDSGALIWRKSARARKSLAAGGYETWRQSPYSNTLTGFDGGGVNRQTHLIVQDGRVRTLTLTEWERLQGFPDGHTAGVPDGERFTMLGNAMNVHMADWLGRRLLAVHQSIPMIPAVA